MNILITNDDGISSEGIVALAKTLYKANHNVVVVAPSSEASGSSAGVGPVYNFDKISCKRTTIKDIPDIEAYEADALPALLVLIGCMGSFKHKPDLVVAGINRGVNAGRSVMHSGTVGAALTASHFKIPSLAVSIEWSPQSQYWETASEIALHVVDKITAMSHLEHPIVLNLNVPNRPIDQLAGLRVARLCNSGLINGANFKDEQGDIILSLGGKRIDELEDADVNLLRQGYATITALSPVREDDRPEVFHTVSNEIIKSFEQGF